RLSRYAPLALEACGFLWPEARYPLEVRARRAGWPFGRNQGGGGGRRPEPGDIRPKGYPARQEAPTRRSSPEDPTRRERLFLRRWGRGGTRVRRSSSGPRGTAPSERARLR